MLLKPVNRKLAIHDPKLEDLYKVRECHGSEFWGKPYRDAYRCTDLNCALSRLISLAVERADGYFIPGTDLPYILLAMRVLAEMNKLNALDEHQLAGLAWVLVYHRFASVEEIGEICGDYVAELVTVKRYRKDKKEDKTVFVIEDKDDPAVVIVPTCIQKKFIQLETYLLLDVLRNIRTEHDRSFFEANRNLNMYAANLATIVNHNKEYDGYSGQDIYENSTYDYGVRGYVLYERKSVDFEYDYSDYILPDYDYDSSDMVYYKKGFINYEYTKYEYGYAIGDVVQYPYTTEYMEYCDKCRDLFWQRFGLTYEEVESILIELFWDGISPWNPLNDLLYEVKRRYHVNR